jgi:hypothetical protein
MRRRIPVAITFIVGLSMIVQYFIPHEPFASLYDTFNRWFLIIICFAMLLGIGNLVKVHYGRISRKKGGWGYSVVLLCGLAVMAGTGLKWGMEPGSPFFYIFWNVHLPLSSTMFALLSFFIASASYRAFRARNIDASLLLIAAVLVMLGRVPLGTMMWDKLPLIADWIMDYPNLAGQRAIMIGIALGVVSYSLRIILGVERTHLG